jgi:peptidoglycan/xylan/chitin deacetylase (PgdA/CDA1 family)
MGFYWIKTNFLIKKIFSNYIWDKPNSENKIYLTFDDGPTPEITEWVLNQLEKHQAKATFFCIGKNIEANPSIFEKTIKKGHSIGNHTFNHLNGWKTTTNVYQENINRCQEIISENKFEITPLESKIFRPPYGKIKPQQTAKLKKAGYSIIMWDVLSADFDTSITAEKCLDNVISNIKPGSIIVFHDSVKAFKNLEYALPKTLEFINKKGFTYGIL